MDREEGGWGAEGSAGDRIVQWLELQHCLPAQQEEGEEGSFGSRVLPAAPCACLLWYLQPSQPERAA